MCERVSYQRRSDGGAAGQHSRESVLIRAKISATGAFEGGPAWYRRMASGGLDDAASARVRCHVSCIIGGEHIAWVSLTSR